MIIRRACNASWDRRRLLLLTPRHTVLRIRVVLRLSTTRLYYRLHPFTYSRV